MTQRGRVIFTLVRHPSDASSEVLGVFTLFKLATDRLREVDQRTVDMQRAKWPHASDLLGCGDLVELEPGRRWLSERADPERFEIIARELDA